MSDDDPSMGYQSSDPSMGYGSSGSPPPEHGAVWNFFHPGFRNPLNYTTAENLAYAQKYASDVGNQALDVGRVAGNTFGELDRRLAGYQTSGIAGALFPSLTAVNAAEANAAKKRTISGLVTQQITGQSQDDYQKALAAERQKTEEASQRIGPVATFGANMIGSGPVGEIGVGRGIVGALAPTGRGVIPAAGRWAVNRLAGAGETGTMSALAAEGRGEDPLKAGLWGATTGSLIGPLGIKGSPEITPASTLEANTKQAYAPLPQYKFDPTAVSSAYNAVHAGLDNADRINAPTLARTLDQVKRYLGQQKGTINADQIDKYRQGITNAIGGQNDYRIAKPYLDALDDVLFTATPTSGQGIGLAGAQADAARRASNVEQTNQDFNKWLRDPSSAPFDIRQKLSKDPQFYDYQPGLPEQMNNISNMSMQPPGGSRPWHSLARTVGGAVGETLFGHPFLGELAGWFAGSGTHGAIGAVQRGRIANALKDAQYNAVMGGPRVAGSSTAGELIRQLTARNAIAGGSADATTR